MNLDDSIPIEGFEAPLAPPEWTMSVGLDDAGYYRATVSRGTQAMCTITLTDRVATAKEAKASLAHKARLWIADYLVRSAGGAH